MDDGLIVVDKSFNITSVNSIIEELSEYSQRELLSMNIMELIDAEEIFKAMKEQDDRIQGIGNAYELMAVTKSGIVLKVHVHSNPIMKDDVFNGSNLKITLIDDSNLYQEKE